MMTKTYELFLTMSADLFIGVDGEDGLYKPTKQEAVLKVGEVTCNEDEISKIAGIYWGENIGGEYKCSGGTGILTYFNQELDYAIHWEEKK